jgi:hypothetical protein
VAPAVRGRRVFGAASRAARGAGGLALAGLLAATALLAAGCGGARQDAGEPRGSFDVQILRASFPAHQAIARPAELVLKLRNAGSETIPNVAVSIDSFSYDIAPRPELASPKRPVWIVDEGPGAVAARPVQSAAVDPAGGGQTAYVNTWALGPLAPGGTQTFVWRVTPVKAGTHGVAFRVAAGLSGHARAQLLAGGVPAGHFTVDIASAPPATHVNPETGRVLSGPPPIPAGPVGVAP